MTNTKSLITFFLVGILASIALATKSNAEPLDTGAEAPAIMVITDTGDTLDLAETYKNGPTLVYFYPKADTGGCTKQACNIRDNFSAMEDAGVTVLGVSMDNVASQAAFKKKYNLPFTLIADTEGKLVNGFGVARRANMFPARQSFLVIDGTVVWRDLKASPATQAEDALAALKASHAGKS